MKKNKVFKQLVTLVVLVAVIMSFSVPTFAAAKRPYKDVIKNDTVNSTQYSAIVFLKKYGALKGVVKGKYFYPLKPTTRKEFLKVAINLFGKKYVPITKADKKKYNKHITNVWLEKKINAIEKKITGVSSNILPKMIDYNSRRGDAFSELYGFIKYNKEVRKFFKKIHKVS